jgi:hypothetical protein
MAEVTEPTANDHALFSDALQHFAQRQHELDAALQASQRSLDAQFALHDGHLKQCRSQWTEYARLEAMQRDLYAGMSKEEKAAMHDRLEDEQITMEMAKQELDQWRQAKPGNQTALFLRLVLGRVNYQLWKKADRVSHHQRSHAAPHLQSPRRNLAIPPLTLPLPCVSSWSSRTPTTASRGRPPSSSSSSHVSPFFAHPT